MLYAVVKTKDKKYMRGKHTLIQLQFHRPDQATSSSDRTFAGSVLPAEVEKELT